MKTKALYLAVALGMMLGFSSCNLDTFPSDELNSDLLLQDAKGAEYIMDGCYAVLKDEVDFLGYASGNCYVRHYFRSSRATTFVCPPTLPTLFTRQQPI